MASIETYKRGYHSTGRGHQSTIVCGFCGKVVPRYKCNIVFRGFNIDNTILKDIGSENVNQTKQKIYVCPSCARRRGIVQKKNENGLKITKKKKRK
ncbi:MAG: hypothetical protein B6U87_02565 [Candidatus Aenigmarchaeota archaeon ex4484_52]|nr:MAG: hypothetical protein B6U87_02565 [Candidatus Aenigmarchaeota archaeon ex4484_52]